MTITLTWVGETSVASFGIPFARDVITRTGQIVIADVSPTMTPTLWWYDAAGAPTSIKAVRVQIAMASSPTPVALEVTTDGTGADWPLASVPFASVSQVVSHTRPVADYTIINNSGTYEFLAQNTRNLSMFETREPCVIAQFPYGYLASTGLFGPLLTREEVAADPTLAGVKYLSDTFEPSVRSALFMDTWAASTTPAVNTYATVTADPDTDTITWPGSSLYHGWPYTLITWGLPLVTRVLFRAPAGSTLPAPLVNYQVYWSRDTTGPTTYPDCYDQTSTFKVSLTENGPPIDITSAGTGPFYCDLPTDNIQVPQPIEGYLYDRVATIFLSLAHSNATDFIRPAYRYGWYYCSLVELVGTWRGYWTGKPMDGGQYDLKYSHLRGAYYYYALTGDETTGLAALTAMAEMWRDHAWFTVPYRNGSIAGSTTLWTERLLAAAFEAQILGFFCTGTTSFLTAFQQLLTTAYRHITTQNQAELDLITKPATVGGVVYNWPPQNGWVHNCYQARDGTGSTTSPWISIWMTELVVAPLLEYQEMTDDIRVDEIFIRLGRFLRDTGTAYRTYGVAHDDTFLEPVAEYTTPGSRWLVPPYGAARRMDGTRYSQRDYDDFQHNPDTTILTAAAQRGLVRLPDLDEGTLAPFDTEKACDEAMHHELSWKAAETIATYDLTSYRDPSRPTGTHHTQGYLAQAYAGGPSAIWTYLQDHGVGWPKIRITPQRKVSWWFNGSILQFGLMRQAGFELPTIIQGWVQPPPEPPTVVYGRPDTDVADGAWTPSSGTSLAAMVNEVSPSDVTYVRSGASPSNDIAKLGIAGITIPVTGAVTVSVRARSAPAPVAGGPLVFEEVATNLTALIAAWKVESDALGKPWWPSEIAAGDFTGSGRPDLVVSHHASNGAGSRVFRNTGLVGGVPQFTADAVALAGSWYDMNTEGAAHVVDYNGDGSPDILAIGNAGSVLALNNGSGAFTITSKPTLSMVQMHAGDATGDGRIDLTGVLTRQAGTFRNYVNNGNGTYTSTTTAPVGEWIPLTAAMTLPAMAGLLYGRCRKANFGPVLGELIFVNFGEGAYGGTQYTFVIRDTGSDVWEDVTAAVGIPSVSVLAGIYDFNRDGLLDVLMTDAVESGIYRNSGTGTFVRQVDELATNLSLVVRGSTTLDSIHDFDEDGKPELVIVTARFGYDSAIYRETTSGYVKDFSFASKHPGQIVVTDLDEDGRLDLAVLWLRSGYPAEATVFLNQTTAAGNWINLRLTGPAVNRVAIDALIEVYTAGYIGNANYRIAYLKNNTPGSAACLAITGIGHSHGGKLPIHLGLGTAATVDIRVTHTDGSVVDAHDVTTNQTIAM